jgi:hypothetical protein
MHFSDKRHIVTGRGLSMKSRWKLYRELELIPESIPQPKSHFLSRFIRPIRRSLARSFVQDLSHKHRVLLFERCLGLEKSGKSSKKQVKPLQTSESINVVKRSRLRVAAHANELKSQQRLNRGVFWWGWYNQ